MAHALAEFLRRQATERGWRNRDLERESGLSKQLVSRYLRDDRDTLTRLPEKATIEGFAKAYRVSPEFLLGKAIESLGLGYTSGDFVNSVATASDRDLISEIESRLANRAATPARDRPALAVVPEDGEQERAAYEDETGIQEEQEHPEEP